MAAAQSTDPNVAKQLAFLLPWETNLKTKLAALYEKKTDEEQQLLAARRFRAALIHIALGRDTEVCEMAWKLALTEFVRT